MRASLTAVSPDRHTSVTGRGYVSRINLAAFQFVGRLAAGLAVALAASMAASAASWTTLSGTPPLVIGHRGASGDRPEHTLASYALAIAQGADFIEPDLVFTADGVLVTRHENALAVVDPASGVIREATTDVHTLARWADRRATKVIDGVAVTGWFTEDFTLAELKTLRARERLPQLRPANTAFDDQFEIPTLAEVIALAQAESATRGRVIGLYPELKHSTYFAAVAAARGLRPMEDVLLEALHAAYGNSATAPVFIQSFEVANLRALAARTALPRVQLIEPAGRPYDFVAAGDPRTYADLLAEPELTTLRGYATALGVHKSIVIARDPAGKLLAPTDLVRRAHAAGLAVHAWTFRAENAFLPADFTVGAEPAQRGDGAAEIRAFLATGLDAFFTDHPAVGRSAVSTFTAGLSDGSARP